jgi:hypothetical protein
MTMSEPTYAVTFNAFEEALAVHLDVANSQILKQHPDGSYQLLDWDEGKRGAQLVNEPAPEPTVTGSMFDPNLLRGLDETLAKQAYGYPGCDITMPTPAPKPSSDHS